jgi:hypothetical protein
MAMGNRPVYSSQLGQIKASDISRPPLGVGDSTDQTSQANLRKLNFTNTLYQLAYSQALLLLQHLNILAPTLYIIHSALRVALFFFYVCVTVPRLNLLCFVLTFYYIGWLHEAYHIT